MNMYSSIEAAIDAVINIALAEVGYIEKASGKNLYDKTANAGDKNYTKYGYEMHKIYPAVMDYPAYWCGSYVDWCFYKTFGVCNAKKVLCGDFDDYTVAAAQLYKNKGAWYTSNPKRGDQVFFTNGKRICHTGLVYKVDSKYLYTCEGNTNGSSGVERNGGMVCKKKYALNNSRIAGYGRPLYSLAVSPDSQLTTYDIKTGSKGVSVSVDGGLNIRSYPVSGNVIGAVQNQILVHPTKKTFVSNGDVWYYLPDKNGWISAKYIDGGWVYETTISSPRKWWYIHKGYTCTTNGFEVINGLTYAFDKDGYMYENEEIPSEANADGVVKIK